MLGKTAKAKALRDIRIRFNWYPSSPLLRLRRRRRL